jgi:hypothetical protein
MQNEAPDMVASSIFSQIHSLRKLYCRRLRTTVCPDGVFFPAKMSSVGFYSNSHHNLLAGIYGFSGKKKYQLLFLVEISHT